MDVCGIPDYGFVRYVNGIRPALVFAPSLLVEYGDGEREADSTDGDGTIYEVYLDYVFDWVNENDKSKIGASPLSYDEWKRKQENRPA